MSASRPPGDRPFSVALVLVATIAAWGLAMALLVGCTVRWAEIERRPHGAVYRVELQWGIGGWEGDGSP